MTTLKLPTASIRGSAGYDPEYVSSGAYRQVSYQTWREEQAERARVEGRSFHAPERRPDGAVDGISHVAESPEEIIAKFTDMLSRSLKSGSREEDQAKARHAAYLKDLGSLAQRAGAGDGAALQEAINLSFMEMRASDPIFPNGVGTPGDFLTEFPVPVDTTELITLCDETSLYRALPEVTNDSNVETWRELTELDFLSGCSDIAFPKGECPEDFQHSTGRVEGVPLKHIGALKNLTESDIIASRASIQAGYGVNNLLGAFGPEGLTPGEGSVISLMNSRITDLKTKEMTLMGALILNGWDQLLVDGSAQINPDEFDGLTTLITAANGARCNDSITSGSFDVDTFNAFLMAGCAHPQAIIGNPIALAAISLAYFGMGLQSIFFDRNQNVVPGLHFAGEIMTVLGPITLIADRRFPVTDNGDGTINSTVYPVRLRHNGAPLIYKRTQIPLSYRDLAPGCTAIRFEEFAVTALIVKGLCAQSCYNADFAGLVDDTCSYIHPCIS